MFCRRDMLIREISLSGKLAAIVGHCGEGVSAMLMFSDWEKW